MNSYQDRAYAAESQVRALTKQLHDIEVALAAWMEWKKVQEADRAMCGGVRRQDAIYTPRFVFCLILLVMGLTLALAGMVVLALT